MYFIAKYAPLLQKYSLKFDFNIICNNFPQSCKNPLFAIICFTAFLNTQQVIESLENHIIDHYIFSW